MRAALARPEDFVLPKDHIFLAAATMGTVLRSATAAVDEYHGTRLLGNDVTPVFTAKAVETRNAIGKLFGAPARPDEPASVFFSGNCTNGLYLVAQFLRLTQDDIVVVSETPYCGPWLASQAQVRIVEQSTQAYLDAIAALMHEPLKGRVIVSAEAVHYADGTKLDLPAMYRAAKELPVQSVVAVDASQWWGAFRAHEFADVVSVTGNKWLLAHHGIAVNWVNPTLLAQLTPPFPGWQHGGRFRAEGVLAKLTELDLGGKAWGPMWTLADSVKYLLGLGGLPALEAHIAPLVELATSLLIEGGMSLISPMDPLLQSGNVCFALGNVTETEAFHDRLKAAGVALSFGGGVPRLRLTPGPYTSEADIRRAVEIILREWHQR